MSERDDPSDRDADTVPPPSKNRGARPSSEQFVAARAATVPASALAAATLPAAEMLDRGATIPAREHRFAPMATPDALHASAVDAPLPSIAPGSHEATVFDERYEEREVLGIGGMGEVHLLHDRRIGRDVAAKMIRGGHGSRPDMRSRFLREARVQGQLEHPALVPVYDLGVASGGHVFFTMKRVRGNTLARIIDLLALGDAETTREYSLHKLLAAFSSVCLAVEYAHARGVIHRDLKPDNVMLGGFGEIYVLDWGVARVKDAADIVSVLTPAAGVAVPGGSGAVSRPGRDADAQGVEGSGPRDTVAGTVVGTPGYMPPEQLDGRDVDERADVYALGAILFEILALTTLHPRGDLGDVSASTMRGADARASVRAPSREVPPELEAICVRATALRPGDRYGGAREVHDAVQAYLEGDRDLARRRELAAGHAKVAREACEKALARGPHADTRDTEEITTTQMSVGGTQDARAAALREVGHALALDPGNPEAMRVLIELLETPPQELPLGARRELEQTRVKHLQYAAKVQIGAYGTWFFLFPFAIALGIVDWSPLVVGSVLLVVAAIVTWVGARPERVGSIVYPLLAHALVCGTIAVTTRQYGALTMSPLGALVSVLGFGMNHPRRWRVVAAVMSGAAVLLPLVLEAAGVLTPTYSFAGGQMTVTPHVLSFERPVPTLLFLAFINVVLLAVGLSFVGWTRDAMTRHERRAAVQAWHFRQLVPPRATAPGSRSEGRGK